METEAIKAGSEQKKRRFTAAELALTALFLLFIGSFFVLFVFLPKQAGKLSGNERRMLADYPINIEGLKNGTLERELYAGELSDNVDDFLEDHFPARSFFVAMNSYYGRLTGRNATESITWGKNGRLYASAADIDYGVIDGYMDRALDFTSRNELDAVFAIIPSAGGIVTEELPLIHDEYKDIEAIAHIREYAIYNGAKAPDIPGLYLKQKDAGALYLKTDHHWTMEGAYLCYVGICDSLGVTPIDRTEFSVTGYEFYGTSYGSAGLWLTKPDCMEIWEHESHSDMMVTIGYGASAVTHNGVYDWDKLAEGYVDKYQAYLYSNNGITIINNDIGNGETLVIVKDSFGNSIAPLLAVNYSTVIMVDTRYYSPAYPTPTELAEEYGATQLLFVYGIDTFASDTGLAWLR